MMAGISGADLPAIGGAWRGGNYIGDIVDGGVTYHLVLAPKATGQQFGLTWKTTATDDTGADSTTNGLANSNALNDVSHPAAQFCRGLTIGGFNDWYLPAKDELNVVYTNRASVGGGDALDVDTTYYWASTESNSTQAWLQRFSDGNASGGTKNTASFCRLRAIRRVPA
jgi:hypothetical protein